MMKSKFEAYLRDIEGDTNGVVREDYTHYTSGATYITKVRHPQDNNIVVTLQTRKLGKKLTGSIYQYGAASSWTASPLNAFIQGNVDLPKTFWNEKAQGEKPLPSWLDRALRDHLQHFYKTVKV